MFHLFTLYSARICILAIYYFNVHGYLPSDFMKMSLVLTINRGVPRIWKGGDTNFFVADFVICMSQSDILRMAKPCALLGGSGVWSPIKFFITVQFGAF